MVERCMLGENADRIHQVERPFVERLRKQIPVNQGDSFRGDGVGPVRRARQRSMSADASRPTRLRTFRSALKYRPVPHPSSSASIGPLN